MTAEYRLVDEIAIARRESRLTLLALDGRLDPVPIVVEGSGIAICDALTSWKSIASLSADIAEHYGIDETDITVSVCEFVELLSEYGLVDLLGSSAAAIAGADNV